MGANGAPRATKREGDDALRPAFDAPEWNDADRAGSPRWQAHRGSRRCVTAISDRSVLTNRQIIWERAVRGSSACLWRSTLTTTPTPRILTRTAAGPSSSSPARRTTSAAAASCPLVGVFLAVRAIAPNRQRPPAVPAAFFVRCLNVIDDQRIYRIVRHRHGKFHISARTAEVLERGFGKGQGFIRDSGAVPSFSVCTELFLTAVTLRTVSRLSGSAKSGSLGT